MKSFLIKLFLFISIPFSLILIFESLIWINKTDIFSEQKMSPIFLNKYAQSDWLNNLKNDKPKILLGGNSTVRYGLNCRLLNSLNKDSLSFINIGFDARDPIETYFILKHFNLKNVKTFYYGIDPIDYTKAFYKNRPYNYYLDLNISSCINYFSEHDNLILIRRYKMLLDYYFPSNENYKKTTEIPTELGSTILNDPPIDFNDAVFEKFQIEKYGWSQIQFIYLNKIKNLCKEKNIEFYALIMPRRTDYTVKYIRDCKSIQSEFETKIKNYFKPKHFIGKINQVAFLGDDSKLYENSAHLNAEGQQIFTNMFYNMINKKQYYDFNEPWFKN